MDQNTFLYIIPQWLVFVSVVVIIYGWVEKKKIFGLIGLGFIVILAIFALYIINSGYFVFHEFLTPEEIVSEALEEEMLNELPLQAKLLPPYWLFVVSGLMAIPTLFFEWKNKKYARLFKIITGLIAMGGFFLIVGILKN
jgi:hypothetical protein